MDINWFPGHMAKSTRDIENNLKIADCVLYVLDCRAVRSCINPAFNAMINVPVVYVLNKADTVPKEVVGEWTLALTDDTHCVVSTDGTSPSSRSVLLGAIKSMCADTLARQKKRGLNSHIRAIVVGVPNTGKSTLINNLCKKSKLVTGDRAGVTRTAAWTRVDEKLDVLDTPGTLYPKIADRTVGENLAIIGSIKDEVLDAAELAVALIDRLNSIDTEILRKRYVEDIAPSDGIERIALLRGCKVRGGEPDVERAAKLLIDDFRKGRLGKIALERAHNG